MNVHRALLLCACLASAASAQTLRGGDVVAADFGTDTIQRISASGVTPLFSGLPLTQPTGVAVTGDRKVAVVDFSGTLFLVSAPGVIAPIASGLSQPIRVAVDRNGDFLVTELATASLLRITPAGVVSTIASGPPFLRPFGVALDGNGDYLVVDDQADALFRVTPAGAVSTLHQGPPFQLPQGVAVFASGDFAVFDGIVDAVFRVPRGGGAPSVLVAKPALGNPCGIAADFEGGFLVSESSSTQNRVVRVASNGALSVLAQGAPFSNLEGVARVPRLSGPHQAAAGATLALDLDLVGEGGRFFALFAALTQYPGIPLPPPDPRGSPLVFDALFALSFGQNDATFVGWFGVLDLDGRAAPALVVPPLSFPPGLAVFVQGISLDVSTGVLALRSLTNVLTLVF